MSNYPEAIVPVGHVEPVPRRVRAMLGTTTVLDTTRARYVWEISYYPQFYVPVEDIDPSVLVDEGEVEERTLGPARRHGLRLGSVHRPGSAWVHDEGDLAGLARITWSAMDAWLEEDEEVYVHPRSPYSRVDALRSTRTVRIEKDGVLLAESSAPVLVFETGLPTRYYLPRTSVHWEHFERTDTVTQCPYKGLTSDYWSVRTGGELHEDLAWSYAFPTRQLAPVAGLVGFYDEKLDVTVDGKRLDPAA